MTTPNGVLGMHHLRVCVDTGIYTFLMFMWGFVFVCVCVEEVTEGCQQNKKK